MVETQGKSMGMRLSQGGFSNITASTPGPGTYKGDKLKKQDYKFSIGPRLPDLKPTTAIPGPGAYNS